MKVRDENYHHVLSTSFFPIIAIIPLIIVILSSTENISVSTIFLFLTSPFSVITSYSIHYTKLYEQEGELKVRGQAVLVYYDFKLQKAIPLPESIREILKRHMFPSMA